MRVSDFHFDLPDELIARYPKEDRSSCRLLQLNGENGEISHRTFTDVLDLIDEGDLLIFNNTRVIPARMFGRKTSGGKIEVLVERVLSEHHFLAHIRSSKAPKEGAELFLGEDKLGENKGVKAIMVGRQDTLFEVELADKNRNVLDVLQEIGHMPLPPYIDRPDEEADQECYQTVYNKVPGAVAAPTAGLHFDDELLQKLHEKGVNFEFVTLHVGAGTFQPVRVENIEDHIMHAEYVELSQEVCNAIIETKKAGKRVIAVGTTSVRTLESLYYIGCTIAQNPEANQEELHVKQWQPYETSPTLTATEALQNIADYMRRNNLDALHTSTQIIIAPGYEYHIVKRIVTNFHQPQSTLLLLVSAFVKGDWKRIYDYALSHDFRFLSYGDSSLLIP